MQFLYNEDTVSDFIQTPRNLTLAGTSMHDKFSWGFPNWLNVRIDGCWSTELNWKYPLKDWLEGVEFIHKEGWNEANIT